MTEPWSNSYPELRSSAAMTEASPKVGGLRPISLQFNMMCFPWVLRQNKSRRDQSSVISLRLDPQLELVIKAVLQYGWKETRLQSRVWRFTLTLCHNCACDKSQSSEERSSLLKARLHCKKQNYISQKTGAAVLLLWPLSFNAWTNTLKYQGHTTI